MNQIDQTNPILPGSLGPENTSSEISTAPKSPVTKNVFTKSETGNGFSRGANRKGGRARSPKEPRVKPEFDQKIINIRRVARVVAGGRRFAFSVALVSGNRKGMVGIGLGKGADTAIAIDKATRDAKKNMISVPLNEKFSIPFETGAKYSSSQVVIKPAPGRGIVAGTSVRNVLELAGLKEISAKLRSGSKNRLNNARAALRALALIGKHLPLVTGRKSKS